MNISRKVAGIAPSMTLSINAKEKQMKAEGIDVIGFGAGEPDFDTPQHVKDACIKAIKDGVTKYTPSEGTPALRKAIAEKLEAENGLRYSPSDIVVSCGAKHSLFNAIFTITNEGDEIIIPAPYWLTYPEQVSVSGGVPVYVHAGESTSYRVTADMIRSRVTAKTKAVILNSPSNPSGAVVDPKELEKIAALALEKKFYIISDEIYEKILYDGKKHVSIASISPEIKEQTILVNGFSKSFAMTGWRLGYTAGPKNVICAMSNFQSHSTSNPTSFAQAAAITALKDSDLFVKTMLESFTRRRKLMVDGLNAIPGIKCLNPDGAFYVYPSIRGLIGKKKGAFVITDAMSFTEYLLAEARVAVVPGTPFGSPENIRLSYATSDEKIKSGLDRMETAIKQLQ